VSDLKYFNDYPEQVRSQIEQVIAERRLGALLLRRYPVAHQITTDRALYDFTVEIKNRYLRKSSPLSKVVYEKKTNMIHEALGTHSFVSRVQGNKLKASNEIRVDVVLKTAPLELLRMIVVHELAHLKEKQHNKAFYQLCEHMEPDYLQLEFDLRLYLTHLDLFGPLY